MSGNNNATGSDRMIFVSGANGKFAGSVIATLLDAGKANQLVVGTRNADSPFARELAGKGITVRAADFRQPEQMRRALEGVGKALFIPTYDTNDVRLQQNMNALQAAKDAGVAHVVYASFLRAESPLVEHSRLVHFPTEQVIRASGLGFTLLRHALYADILVGDIAETLATGLLHRPSGSAHVAYIARADLGVSAAHVLMRNEASGHTYTETMERTYSGEEVAEIMSDVFGKSIRFAPVDPQDWPRYMTEKWGVPPEISKSTVGTMQAVAAGVFDLATQDYATITGRPPRDMRAFLEGVRDARR